MSSISATRSALGVVAAARIARDVLRRDRSELRPALERGELDLEPACELALLRPDPAHLGPGVAGDHEHSLEAAPPRALPTLLQAGPRIRAASTAAFFALSTPTVATGTPGRHLHDREQRVEPVEDAHRRAERHADHRQLGLWRRRRRGARRRARRRRSAPGARGPRRCVRTRRPRRASGAPSAPRTPRGCRVHRARRAPPASAARSDSEPTRMPTRGALTAPILALIHRSRGDTSELPRQPRRPRSGASMDPG